MDWHARYTQQAGWTRELRDYLFEKAGLAQAQRVLEVGCGTGAILSGLNTRAAIYGLDIDPVALGECRQYTPGSNLVRGNALRLPYASESFDITFCHFLLLWVKEPLEVIREMKRVTCREGHILALAEPDYSARQDEPAELAKLGRLQTEALRRQGADPALGGRLADLFARAGLEIIETGVMQRAGGELNAEQRELEWAVIEADLADSTSGEELQRLKRMDEAAWARGERRLYVPTYFAWGKIC